MTVRKLAVLVAVMCLRAAIAEGQLAGGSAIQGRVFDQQQAVLPGVAIVVTNQDNGTFRETVSGPDGTYFVTGILPGRYKITADLSGFKKFTREDVTLVLGSTQTVDLRLEVGGLTESVTVSEEAPPVDLTSTKVGGNVESKQLLELPSATRNFIGFIAMIPGIQYNPSDQGSDSISINGQSNNQVTFVLDGGNNTDDNSASASGAQARAPLETVEEFQVQTNQFDVEFGRTTGGVVNAITKRGTNTFHGSGFGYLTNASMTSPTIFVKQSNGTLEKPDTNQNQYGGTLGGPILRNKIHFFFSYERYDLGQGITDVFAARPDLNLTKRQGQLGVNYMARGDHQINSNNTYTIRYLTEWQPDHNLYNAPTATATSANYQLDRDQTANVAYNRVIGSHMLNTVRWSIEKEEIHRGADPLSGHQSFLITNDKTLELPVLNHLSFTEQGHTNAQHRTNTAPGLDDTFAWFVPGKAGDHDMKFGMQYLFDQNVLDDQGSMNGAFSFSSDKEFNAADPSTYPERLTIRVPIESHTSSHEHSFAFYGQDKWRMTKKITLNLGLRYDVDIFPLKQARNPLVTGGYPVDKNNFQPRAGLAYNIDGKSVVRAGIGKYYEKLFLGQLTPLQSSGVFGDSFTVNFPVNGPDPGPSRGQLPTDPMLVNGPTINRALLAQLYPAGTLTRNSATVQYDTPGRQAPTSVQISTGYERQFGKTIAFGADYIHNSGRGWVGYDLNPGLKADTSRTGTIIRTDLLGLASQLGIPAFASSVNSRFDYSGRTKYDGLNLSLDRRFAGFWSGRVAYTLGYARGNNSGAPNAVNNFQVLAERHLDLNYGPLDTDRRHNVTVSGSLSGTHLHGATVGAVYRIMTGRPFTITDSTVDADRNGIAFDPLPAGSYTGSGANALTVKNSGGRNGAYGPSYAQLDTRFGYRLNLGAARTVDLFAEVFNLTNRSNFSNPSGDRRLPATFLIPTGFFGGNFPRQLQLGARLGF